MPLQTSATVSPRVTGAEPTRGPGLLGRLGIWSVNHRRHVFVSWLLLVVAMAFFAPSVEKSLSGAGWQADGSQSVLARNLAQRYFGGQASSAIEVVVHSTTSVNSPEARQVLKKVEATLAADPRVARVIAPRPGLSISKDQKTAIVMAGAGADTNTMVRAADALQGPLAALSTKNVSVTATGSSVLWADFNTANRNAMMKSELFSWPVTLGILVLAFGSLVAAGLPLLLTMAGLLTAAGMLDLLTKVTPISIWAMNFALMFALALGIDYALFIVVRFRAAHFGRSRDVAHSVGETMDSAGKAVLFSGLTVLISLSSVMIVPSPAFRSMAGGIMLAVVFVLAASLTLLPAVLGKLGDRVDALQLPWVHAGEHRSVRFGKWGAMLWRRPLVFGGAALVVLLALALPVLGLRTAMPSIKVVPANAPARVGYQEVQSAFGPGAPGQLQVLVATSEVPGALTTLRQDPGIAGVLPPQISASRPSLSLIDVVPSVDPSSPKLATTLARLRSELPPGALVGGAAAENIDLQHALVVKTPQVIGLVLLLGFLLLVVALRALLVALLGVVTSLLATAGAFGVARLVFQDGWGHSWLHFTPQGFLDAWGPVFFFAMIFAISMDYTVFLLSSAKEHYERSGDPKDAMINGVAHSGRVIFSAAAVMVAVFFTFSLSGPLPPKEMGIILGVAVLLDAFLVRLALLPVLLRLTGRAAWWLPTWLDKLLPRVSFAHD
ncbi:MAG: multidrug RND transporter [Actinobacteria bacterium 21-64-8]|nr:MAG: multidrug RND transporter [Actinobacteria bacterium 21-64-8]